jgi:hypothetical protein
VARALADCDPGRVITTSGGSTVRVTARESKALLAFSAARLRSDPGHALIAKVQGLAPTVLARRPALLGLVLTGTLPREVTVEPGGQAVLITKSVSHQLEAVKVSGLK